MYRHQRLTLTVFYLVCLFVYFWLIVDPRLIYHGGGIIRGFPVFFFGWDFLSSQLTLPGGMIYYLSAFLSQFLYISWAGALILTLKAALYTLLLDLLLIKINGEFLRWLRFIPGFILIALYSGYSYHFNTALTLLFAWFSTWIYLSLPLHSQLRRSIAFILTALITYWIAGAAFYIFAISLIVYSGIVKREFYLVFSGTVLMIIIPYVTGTLLCAMNPADAYRIGTPLYWQEQLYRQSGLNLVLLLYCILPGCVIFLTLKPYYPQIGISLHTRIHAGMYKLRFVPGMLSLLFLLATGYAVYFFSFNHATKRNLTIDYHACHQEWYQVLEQATGTINDGYVIAAINRALYHTQKLGDYMPLWQKPDHLLLLTSEYANAYWYKFDLFLDLGFINMAQHNLNEALEFYGEQPLLLKRLALIHLIKGNIGTARIYLNLLRKTVIYRNWANTYLQALTGDPQLTGMQEIVHYRGIMLDRDYPFPFSTNQLFNDLLAKNSRNRMAFEYLMALSLLTKDFHNFMGNLKYLKNFNYRFCPKLYQQAILVITSNPDKFYDIPEIAIDSGTIELYRKFVQIINQNRNDMRKAISMLQSDYSNNYFYYCLTH